MHTVKQKRTLRIFLYCKEAVMLLLVASSLLFVGLEHFGKFTHEQLLMIEVYEVIVGLVFVGEFIFEWYHAKDRQHYLKYHWFYLFAAVPVPLESFELLRGIRALRLLKLVKAYSHLKYEYNTHLFDKTRTRTRTRKRVY